MPKLEFIEDKKSYNPGKASTKVLLDDHRLMHIGWHTLSSGRKWGSWNKEDVWNTHTRIVEEMKRRGLKHNIVEKRLDSITLQELEVTQVLKDVIAGMYTFVVSEEFISIAGSAAEGNAAAQDIDFVIKLKAKNDLIESKLAKQPSLKALFNNLHFIYDTKGSHGKHIVIYDLVAVRRGDLAVENPGYSFPLFGAAPQGALLTSSAGIMSCYLHREQAHCELIDEKGNRIINFPHLETEGAGMPRPDTFILGGEITSDGQFLAKDIFRWNSTELIESKPEDRSFFLDKIEWTPNIKKAPIVEDGLEFEEKLTLMKPFIPLKARQGFGEFEFNDIGDLIKFWVTPEILRSGIAVQGKADGFRIVWHKKGLDVKGFTEDKHRDRADMLPAIKNAIKDFAADELILDTEVVMCDKEGKPLPRHEGMAIIASKTPIQSPVKASIHDCLWFNGPKNDKPYVERIALVKKLLPNDNKVLHSMRTMIAHTESEMRTHIKHAAKEQGSEGAMLKVLDSPYPLNGRTPLWAKLKLVKEVTVKVIGIRKKKAAGGKESEGTFLYRIAYSDGGKLAALNSQHIVGPGDLKEEAEWSMGLGFRNSRPGEYAYAETYSSNVSAKLGQLITIAPIHILKFSGKDGKERYATMFPRVRGLETAKTQPDDKEQLEKLAALGEGSSKMTLQEILKTIKPADFPLTIKEA